jgi:mono/diheme cytochrome c family protein
MRHLLFALAVLALLLLLLALAAAKDQKGQGEVLRDHSQVPSAVNLVPAGSAQVKQGARLYDEHCAVCHGGSALGFAEAKTAFPKDHQRCERCHKRNNPAHLPMSAINAHNVFSVGEPPALRGPGTLAPSAASLYAFIHTQMPRQAPGSLSQAAYLELTAFLLALHHRLPAGATLKSSEVTPGG